MMEFPRKQIERSFRTFSDRTDDLNSADHASWIQRLKLLIHHCRSDAVMQVVLAPLTANEKIDIAVWVASALATRRYTLPTDDDERLALIYQFLLGIHDGNVDVFNFGMFALGAGTQLDETFDKLNEHFVAPFERDIGYRLEEALERIEDQESVPMESIAIFGPVIGSAIGTGATVVADDITVFATSLSPELKDAFNNAHEATKSLPSLSDNDRQDVLDDLRKLFEVLSGEEPEPGRIRRYWNRIKDIAPPVGVSLQAIQMVASALAAG